MRLSVTLSKAIGMTFCTVLFTGFDQPTETVTLTVPYSSLLKSSVVELRRAWRGYEKARRSTLKNFN